MIEMILIQKQTQTKQPEKGGNLAVTKRLSGNLLSFCKQSSPTDLAYPKPCWAQAAVLELHFWSWLCECSNEP